MQVIIFRNILFVLLMLAAALFAGPKIEFDTKSFNRPQKGIPTKVQVDMFGEEYVPTVKKAQEIEGQPSLPFGAKPTYKLPSVSSKMEPTGAHIPNNSKDIYQWSRLLGAEFLYDPYNLISTLK